MVKANWGPNSKKNDKIFLETVLCLANKPAKGSQIGFEWEVENSDCLLKVNTEKKFLLERTELSYDQLRTVTERLKKLEIMYESVSEKGSKSWKFKLKLWSQNTDENLSRFEEEYGEKYKEPDHSLAQQGETLLPTEEPPDGENTSGPHPRSAEPELPEGLVPLDSHFYIERHVDSSCPKAIRDGETIIRIKAPQKMGKTSILERNLAELEKQGYETVNLTFETDRTVFSDVNKFTQYFCACVSKRLGMDHHLDNYWDNTYGCIDNVTDYFEDYLLARRSNPLVLALDNFDLVFEQPEIASECCGLLRSWHNLARRSGDRGAIWKKLRLIVVHSTDVYSSLDIINSPLNGVGLVVLLKEFESEQVIELTRRYGFDYAAPAIEELIKLVGGHPYLLRLAFDHLKFHEGSVEKLLQIASTEASPFRTYLREHLKKLQQKPELATAFQKVIRANEPMIINPTEAFKLESMGLVKVKNNYFWTPSCQLYSQYFLTQFEHF